VLDGICTISLLRLNNTTIRNPLILKLSITVVVFWLVNLYSLLVYMENKGDASPTDVYWNSSLQIQSVSWPLKKGTIGCPETSVSIYKSILSNIPEEGISNFHRGGSVNSFLTYYCVMWGDELRNRVCILYRLNVKHNWREARAVDCPKIFAPLPKTERLKTYDM
jgi:hypothetical protein